MRLLTFILFTLFSFIGIGTSARAGAGGHDVYGIDFKSIDGQKMPLAQYKGKVLLIVNVASRCGFTPQYAGLEKLYETYKDKGFVVIGVPSNDFGGQEPGSEADIKQFAASKYHATFPLTAKEVVTGGQRQAFFQQVHDELGIFASPQWNFYKYVVSRDGHIVAWYSSKTKPDSEDLKKMIEAELAK